MPDEATTRRQFFEQLVEHGHFIPTGVAGIYGRGAEFEDVIARLGRIIDKPSNQDQAERVHFPPVMNRMVLEQTGYMGTMPHLGGCVHSFAGDEADHHQLLACIERGADWSALLQRTDVALTPAACYPIYPMCADQDGGQLPQGGRRIDLLAWIFRNEPSNDPSRLQAFRQREMVRLGTPDEVLSWRRTWMDRGLEILRELGLEVETATANDPFFGRGGRMLKSNQRSQELKFEIQTPICSKSNPTAITSFNYHESHFGDTFGIRTSDGEVAHTACLGFGMERITLALLRRHGTHIENWPNDVRNALGYDR